MRCQQFAVGLDVGLELGVGIGIVVDEMHLVSLHHHPRIGRPDSPCANHAHSLALNKRTLASNALTRSVSLVPGGDYRRRDSVTSRDIFLLS